MIGLAWPLLRAGLGALDAETAHELTLAALERIPRPASPPDDPRLATHAFGLAFPNPVGLAAGFDKDARAPDAMFGFGFGFVEIGTLTPNPQTGNPRPRVFRCPEDLGVINRLGFNNAGHEAARRRLVARRGRPGVIGVNVGASKDSRDRAADYVDGVAAFAEIADYLTINVSSPNTPGLRDLQARASLDDLLARVIARRDAIVGQGGTRRPILLKLAPDLGLADLDDAVEVALARGIDGLVISNTTLARPAGLAAAASREAGGLSGAPLFRRATWMLAETFRRVGGRVPIVGVGGITTAATALAKIRAGATLIQLYTGLIYAGPALVGDIKRGLLQALETESLPSLSPLVGRDAEPVAAEGPGAERAER